MIDSLSQQVPGSSLTSHRQLPMTSNYEVVFTVRDNTDGHLLKKLNVITLSHNSVYTLVFAVDAEQYDTTMELAQQMISSFSVVSPVTLKTSLKSSTTAAASGTGRGTATANGTADGSYNAVAPPTAAVATASRSFGSAAAATPKAVGGVSGSGASAASTPSAGSTSSGSGAAGNGGGGVSAGRGGRPGVVKAPSAATPGGRGGGAPTGGGGGSGGGGGGASGTTVVVPDTPVRVDEIGWRRDSSHPFGVSFVVPGTWQLEAARAAATVEYRCPKGERHGKSLKVFAADLSLVAAKSFTEKLEELVAHYKQKVESQVRRGQRRPRKTPLLLHIDSAEVGVACLLESHRGCVSWWLCHPSLPNGLGTRN